MEGSVSSRPEWCHGPVSGVNRGGGFGESRAGVLTQVDTTGEPPATGEEGERSWDDSTDPW